ncbi:alpha/beta fold hydrolase [Streptomyces sp. DH12]|uniref:alpha/beta fold hydrolase n=1 Tax=Streptomyces sp. DH12 TaxID=2857010 RepID=UPI001E585FDE|nr:alpha/beta hydrolase [Streptomyces sp. DH12]
MATEAVDRLEHEGFAYYRRVLAHARSRTAPVLFLGGAFQDMRSWRRHESVFRRHTTVVTLDLPGYGMADELPAHHGIDFLAVAAHHAMRTAGFERYDLVGVSYGALVAHRLAQRYGSDVVRSLVLTGAADPRQPLREEEVAALRHFTDLLKASDVESFARMAVDHLSPACPPGPVHRHAAVRRMVHGALVRVPRQARSKIISNTRRLYTSQVSYDGPLPDTPTLVCTGEFDTLTPPEGGRRLATAYPRGTCVTIAETDHLSFVQRDREYAQLLLTHFRGEDCARLPYCRRLPHTHDGPRPGVPAASAHPAA